MKTRMENQAIPNISSFLIRFVIDEGELTPEQPGEQDNHAYRGTIRHIPSGEEIAFTRWQEAVQFIQRFVPIGMETD